MKISLKSYHHLIKWALKFITSYLNFGLVNYQTSALYDNVYSANIGKNLMHLMLGSKGSHLKALTNYINNIQ